MKKRPDFLIIGAQKCGTSSLYKYLIQHPFILHAKRKEIHYFDDNYDRTFDWYLNFFPENNNFTKHCITGEASPYYMFNPFVAERVKKYLPDVKIIVLLRNPIDRAYSQFWHMKRKNRTQFTFEEYINKEIKLLQKLNLKIPLPMDSLKTDEYHKFFLFLSRGLYAQQLCNWFKYFNKKQFLFIKSEDFFIEPAEGMRKVYNFLQVDLGFESHNFKKHNKADYIEMSLLLRNQLDEFFKPHNNELYKLIGINF